ncbi:MAG: phage tail protein, partial [Novosphingobium sp.]
MRKIDSLRATLLAAIPEANNDPAMLPTWIDRGSVRGRQTGSGSFEMAFRLNVLAIGVRTDLSLISLAVTKWLRAIQPERLQPGSDSFTFDADILDNDTADVLIQIDLTQNYEVTTVNGVNRRANGTPYRRAKGTPFHDGARLIGHAPLRCARRREGGARPEARA